MLVKAEHLVGQIFLDDGTVKYFYAGTLEENSAGELSLFLRCPDVYSHLCRSNGLWEKRDFFKNYPTLK